MQAHGAAAAGIAVVLAVVALVQGVQLALPRPGPVAQWDATRIARLEAANTAFERRLAALEAARDSAIDWVPVAARAEPSVFTVVAGNDLGSAWVVRSSSTGSDLVTNYHVVASSWEAGITGVELHQGDAVYAAQVITADAGDDLALIEVDRRFPALTTAPHRAPLATPVMALGSPLGLSGSVSTGVLSSYRSVDGAEFLQFTAPISPGNSGGPVVDAGGEVLGVATEKAVGDGIEALGFAIPVQTVCGAVARCETGAGAEEGT